MPHFFIFGYIIFSVEQRDEIIWSLDSSNKINHFRDLLETNLKSFDQTFSFSQFSGSIINESQINALLVSIVHSFIQIIQIAIWAIGLIIVVFSIIGQGLTVGKLIKKLSKE